MGEDTVGESEEEKGGLSREVGLLSRLRWGSEFDVEGNS